MSTVAVETTTATVTTGAAALARARLGSRDDALAAIARIAPLVREAAQRTEEQRTMPPDLVAAVDETGLWGAFTPIELGGSGLGRLVDIYEITRTMGYEDTGTGWSLALGAVSPMLVAARLPAEGRAEVFRHGVTPMAGSFAPSGRLRRVDDGVVVTGRWSFGSGIHHAGWVMATAVEDTGAAPPDPSSSISVIVPRDEVRVIDDWYVAGLRGTGSCSFELTDTFVPNARAYGFYGPFATDDLRHRVPLFTVIAAPFTALAVAFAQRALREVVTSLPGRRRPPMLRPMAEEPTVQRVLGSAMAAVRAADITSRSLLGKLDARIDDGEDLTSLSIDDRAELHSHAAWVAETCVAQVDTMFRLGGASALYETSVLQRCWRDLNALVQHMYFDAHFHEVAASCALGLAADAPNV